MSRFKIVVCMLLFVIGVVLLCLVPIRTVTVVGDFTWLDNKQIYKNTEKLLSQGFFRLSLQELATVILNINGVEAVSLQRVWPRDVIINLQARQPILMMSDSSVVDKSGVVFKLNNEKNLSHLPKLLVEKKQVVGATKLWIEFSKVLQPRFTLLSLGYIPLQGWSIVLNNKLKIMLGKHNLLFRLNRFMSNFDKLPRKRNMAVDLRYRNGFAVKFY